jgi:hypothetical protein
MTAELIKFLIARSVVIARSVSDEAIQPSVPELDCFASLAMTSG